MGGAAAAAQAGGYGNMHFRPPVGAYQAPTQPFNYTLGGIGGFRYNAAYANPYTYHNPYMYRQFSNPYQVPFTHAF